VRVAGLNVKVNAVNLHDQALAALWHEQVANLEAEVNHLVSDILTTTAVRGGFSL